MQSDALRADFLAYNHRTAMRGFLDRILKEDPNNVSAHETKAFWSSSKGQLEEAHKRYAQAVQLDSQSYLAHYDYAVISMDAPRKPRTTRKSRAACEPRSG